MSRNPLLLLLFVVTLTLSLNGQSKLANALSSQSDDDQVWCRNMEGRKVEWFIMYKVPKTAGSNKQAKRYDLTGSEFGYVDSETPDNAQTFADGVDGVYSENHNPLANSLSRLFKRQKTRSERELTYIAYNDQPPSDISNSSSNGHTKGVVLFGSESGIWIIHSVPRFPDKFFTGKYSFPANARENGQSILCVTFKSDMLNSIAAHLRKQNPNMYAASAPPAVRKKYKELDLLLDKKFPRTQPFILKDVLSAINGTSFTAFAKSGRLNKDIYSSVLAPTLETDLFVETWRNGNGGKLPPDCLDKFKVTDVQKIALRVGSKTMRWASQEDHSKWAVGDKGNWFCVGSINRMLSQYKRGGETFCLQRRNVHDLFANAMVEYASCSIDGIRTRGRTHQIEDLLRSGDERSLVAGGVETEDGGGTASPAMNTGRQSALIKAWEAQKKKLATELEGIRAYLG